MTLRPALLALAVTAALAACGKTEPPAPATDVAATPAEAPPPAMQFPADLPLSRFRGQAVMGKDGYGMTVCGDTRQLVVGFTPEAQKVLDGFLAGGAKEFFIDAWGTTDAQARPQLSTIERIYTEGPGCDEKDMGLSLFRVRGNEPFWAVDVSPSGVKIERPDQPELIVEYQPLEKIDGGGRRFSAITDQGPLDLVLTPGTCSDGMSDTVYGWNAVLTLGESNLKGCAFSGLMSE